MNHHLHDIQLEKIIPFLQKIKPRLYCNYFYQIKQFYSTNTVLTDFNVKFQQFYFPWLKLLVHYTRPLKRLTCCLQLIHIIFTSMQLLAESINKTLVIHQPTMCNWKLKGEEITFCVLSTVANSTSPYPLKFPSASLERRMSTTSPASLKKFFLQKNIDQMKIKIKSKNNQFRGIREAKHTNQLVQLDKVSFQQTVSLIL